MSKQTTTDARIPPGDSPEIPMLKASRWFYLTMILTQYAVYASFGAGIAVLLPATATAIAGDGKVGALGLITAVGALGALLAQPIVGRLSDRTRWGLGRRATWVVIGGVVGAAALASMTLVASIVAVAVILLIAQVGLNGVVAMINASLPDRVPLNQRARVSGALGIALAVGAASGIILAGFIPNRQTAWLVLAALVLVTTLLFALTNPDVKAPVRPPQPARTAGPRRSVFAGLPRSKDYWWAFGSKFAVFMTYQAITSYLFFILSDHIQLEHRYPGMNLAQTVSLLSLISLVALTIVSAIGGILADKLGKLKPFVLWSAVGFALPGIILIVWPTLPGIIIAQLISGASFGLYAVVDQALLSRVIPAESDAARDLGVLNIAGAVPNVAAPAVAGLLISTGGGYTTLFIFASACAVLGGLLVRPIKSVQ